MRIISCLTVLACIAAVSPALAADQSPFPALADPELAFRTPGSDPQASAASGSSSPNAPAGSPEVTTPSTGQGSRLLDRTLIASNEAPSIQVAQAPTAPAIPQATAQGTSWESQPLIFGATIYGWIPFATGNSTIHGLLGGTTTTSWPHTDISITNLFGGAGEFRLTKGDWGLFGNITGGYLGLKGVILKEDPHHTTREDRSGYSHSSTVDGQYGISYRLVGQPLDLTKWAREKQPVSLDLMAGGQTIYVSTSFSTEREHASASITLTSPLLVARFSWDMADRWNLGLGGNIGGFGVSDTDLTWQVDLVVSYRFLISTVPSAVTLGFRVQGINISSLSDSNGLKLTETLFGPLFGFSMFF